MVAAVEWWVNNLCAYSKPPKLLSNTFFSFGFPTGKLKDLYLNSLACFLQQEKAGFSLSTSNWQLGGYFCHKQNILLRTVYFTAKNTLSSEQNGSISYKVQGHDRGPSLYNAIFYYKT